MSVELWKSVPGYEGLYLVSTEGRVKGCKSGKVLAPGLNPRGYLFIDLYRSSKRKRVQVHQVVMAAFVGPRPQGQQVRHLNGDGEDARLSNLCYGTGVEQWKDKVLHGRARNRGTVYMAAKTHCPKGHPYSGDNLYQHSVYGRKCKTCRRDGRKKKA